MCNQSSHTEMRWMGGRPTGASKIRPPEFCVGGLRWGWPCAQEAEANNSCLSVYKGISEWTQRESCPVDPGRLTYWVHKSCLCVLWRFTNCGTESQPRSLSLFPSLVSPPDPDSLNGPVSRVSSSELTPSERNVWEAHTHSDTCTPTDTSAQRCAHTFRQLLLEVRYLAAAGGFEILTGIAVIHGPRLRGWKRLSPMLFFF